APPVAAVRSVGWAVRSVGWANGSRIGAHLRTGDRRRLGPARRRARNPLLRRGLRGRWPPAPPARPAGEPGPRRGRHHHQGVPPRHRRGRDDRLTFPDRVPQSPETTGPTRDARAGPVVSLERAATSLPSWRSSLRSRPWWSSSWLWT